MGAIAERASFLDATKDFFFSNGSMLACTVVALHAGNGEWTLLGSGRRGSQDDDRGLVGAEHVDRVHKQSSQARPCLPAACSVLSPLRWCESTIRAGRATQKEVDELALAGTQMTRSRNKWCRPGQGAEIGDSRRRLLTASCQIRLEAA